MTESFSSLLRYMALDPPTEEAAEVSIMAGGYMVVSTDKTTTIKSPENPTGVVFPRHAVELLVEMLKSHIPSDEDDDYGDDFEEHEAEERLP